MSTADALSQHFTLVELTHSEIAARLGIKNEPSAEVVENLQALCADILEPLRNAVGRPLFVTSGYRASLLNTAIGGAQSSDHILGLAADITVPGMTVDELARAVRALAPFVPLRQCIVEFGRWVHVSRRLTVARKDTPNAAEFLVASLSARGKTVYTEWEA